MDEVSDEVRARGEEERVGVGGGQLDVGGVEAVGEVGAAGGWALAATQLGEGEGEGRGRGREKEWTQI